MVNLSPNMVDYDMAMLSTIVKMVLLSWDIMRSCDLARFARGGSSLSYNNDRSTHLIIHM